MALTRAQNRWRPQIQKSAQARDIPNTAPPPQNAWARGKENHPLPPSQVLAKIVEDETARHDGKAPLGTHKHMNVGEPPNGGQKRDHAWMGKETQYPLSPAQLRAQIIEAYRVDHDGQMPDREYVMKKLWEAADIHSDAEPRLKQSGGVPLSGER
jgi:hypothetical protein